MDYSEYVNNWMSGIQSEISFWNNFIIDEGGAFFYGFEKTVNSNRPFELEDDIPDEFLGKDYKFIDVGSGPFSRCGHVTKKVELDAVSVDPLAFAYDMMKRKYGIDNGIDLKTGFVELLDKQFDSNTFDMVHMSNSLDHCFSAIDGIYQLINICKIGGKIILRHHENEAENENYVGLHQWNLSLHNSENSFIIWRANERYDICKIFDEYASFEMEKDVHERGGTWIYNKVVITKKKDISIPANEYYDVMLNIIYKQLLNVYLDSTLKKPNEKKNTPFNNKLDRIKQMYHASDTVKCDLLKKGIASVAIYGMGCLGKNLEYALEKCGMEIKERIDAKGADSGSSEAKRLNEYETIESDLAILTIDNDDVYQELSCKTKGIVYHLEDFLNLFSEGTG